MADEAAPKTDLCPMCSGKGEHSLLPPFMADGKTREYHRSVIQGVGDETAGQRLNALIMEGYKLVQTIVIDPKVAATSAPNSNIQIPILCIFILEWRWM
jgi:hypothetical protein